MDKTIETRWHEADRILSTRVAGILSLDDVRRWEQDLFRAGRQIPQEISFRMLIDIRGYEVADQAPEVHRVQREVTPLCLASHGFRVGFFDLYGVEPPADPDARSARCTAVAHVHHDCGKMDRYNELLSRASERFFCDVEEAQAWLERTALEPA